MRLVASPIPLKVLSSVVYPYAEFLNLDHYRGPPRETSEQSLRVTDDVVEFLSLGVGERT